MENELRTELEKLNGNLNRIFDRIDEVDKDISSLASDIKDIKSDVAGQGKEIASIQANINHFQIETKETKGELKRVWDHFKTHKDEVCVYAREQDKATFDKMKVWVYGLAGTSAISAISATLYSIFGGIK